MTSTQIIRSAKGQIWTVRLINGRWSASTPGRMPVTGGTLRSIRQQIARRDAA